MKNYCTCIFALLIPFCSAFTQINMADSTAQIIGYWDNGEKQTYAVSFEKYKVKGADTTNRELMTYDVDITIKDSTENSYLIEWYYKNFSVETDNPLVKKIASVAEDMPVLIKTNEFGIIQEVANWEEVRDYVGRSTDLLKAQFKDLPEIDKIITQMMNVYTSKEAVEGNAIKDAQQFYAFHGGKYQLNEQLTGQIQLMNNYGGKPFDTDLTIQLDELSEDAAIIRMSQIVNAEQLTDATYGFLKKMGALGENMPLREDFPPLKNETWTASRIHAASGWILYSIETKEISAEGTLNVEERIIELK